MMRPTYPDWFLFDWRPCLEDGCDGVVVEFRRNIDGTIHSYNRCMKCDAEHIDIVGRSIP